MQGKRLFALLKPMDNGSQEIRALDGLRAMAALSIVVFHALHAADFQHSSFGGALGNFFWFLPTGVHLFFVLSGFLLFLPYARAMLLNRPLPGFLRFYQRRALRILPAYLVVLLALVWLQALRQGTSVSGESVLAHLLMIHDMFVPFNRDFEGPFWTLAVEAQFYLLLPVLALMLSRCVGSTRSRARLLGGIGVLIAGALAVRGLDIILVDWLHAGTSQGFVHEFVLFTMGMQGKYLEVFMMGMLASTVYVVSVEQGALPHTLRRRVGWAVLWAALIIMLLAIPFIRFGGTIFGPRQSWGAGVLIYPLVVGLGYATLLLAILWGSRPVRWLFETPPARFVGHISYSLYLWHDPIILALIPLFAGVPLVVRVACAFPVAYLSYQLVERPFLMRRRRNETRGKPVPQPTPASAPIHVSEDMRTPAAVG